MADPASGGGGGEEAPPSQRVQFILGGEEDEEHHPHQLFSEMDELRTDNDGQVEWKETARLQANVLFYLLLFLCALHSFLLPFGFTAFLFAFFALFLSVFACFFV